MGEEKPIGLRRMKRATADCFVMYTVGSEGRIAIQRFFFRGTGGGVYSRDWGGTFLLGCPASKQFAFASSHKSVVVGSKFL